MEDSNRLKEEKEQLEIVKIAIKLEKERLHKQLKDIPLEFKNRYSGVKWGDEDLVKTLTTVAMNKLKKLENTTNNPYFGRIDFLADDETSAVKLYIGKTELYDKNCEQLTVDWRAPICSLYYDKSLGRVSYEAPQGTINGELTLKSQILIKDGELIDVRDTDLVSDDELISPYLTISADNRMKNIIASIQKEQNTIIRKPLKNNLIVQGVAGSGKTSVALHRIAYLIYNEGEKYRSNQFMVIGPNKYFLNYVSSLLPELEAGPVEQYTLSEIIEKSIDEKIKVDNQFVSLTQFLNTKKIDNTLDCKTSLEYKEAIDRFIYDYINSLEGNIELYGEVIATSEEIKQYLLSGSGSYREIIDNYIKIFTSRVKANSEKISDAIWNKYRVEFKTLGNTDPRRKQILNIHDDANKQLASGCSKLIKDYLKAFNARVLELYRQFISNADKYCGNLEQPTLKALKTDTLQAISKKNLLYEDLPALMYLNMRFNSCREYEKFAHVVIDEAQDFGLFHFYIIKSLFKNSSFTILGDLTQSIYSYRSIKNWDLVKKNIFDSNCNIVNLEKSYRTTVEIMSTANRISSNLDLPTAVPVVRHGDDVRVIDLNAEEKNSYIINRICEIINNHYKTCAIICKTEAEALREFNYLQSKGVKATHITHKDVEYNGGICVTTGYLAKGLEFDAVIINDASEKNYNSSSLTDMKLLYIAMTRPLHSLDIVYSDQITKYLEPVEKDNVKTKK